MGRLKYSRGAMLRRIAMARDAALFVFVEGKVNDPFLADFLCATSPEITKRGYEIRKMDDIARDAGQGAGGKSAAIDFYDYCKAKGKLVQSNLGGDRIIAFLVDRDAQQIVGGRRRSSHVIYTLEADAEAHLYAGADQVGALALAATIDRREAAKLANSLGDWRAALANEWRPWIELCYLAEAVRSRCWVGFGKAKSHIHEGDGFGKLNLATKKLAEREVEKTALVRGAEYSKAKAKIYGAVAAQYTRGTQATLLKGKWLAQPLASLVKQYFDDSRGGNDSWNNKDFAGSVARCFAARLDANSTSVVHLRTRLEALLVT
jgi:hypothetical protein